MLKGGIKTAHNRSLKRSYKNLTKEQYRAMKIIEAKDTAEKFLYGFLGFYTTAPRLENQTINWDLIEVNTIKAFELANKAIAKFNKMDESLVSETLKSYRQGQFSYSQSF